MTSEEKRAVIQSYIAAYNSFDIDGMLVQIHPEVRFRHLADGKVAAEAVGIEEFRNLAVQAKALQRPDLLMRLTSPLWRRPPPARAARSG